MRLQIRIFIGLAAIWGLGAGAMAQTKISSGLSVSHQLIDYVIPPAGDRVIYRAGPKGPSFPHVQSQLYSVLGTGGVVTPLTSALGAGVGVSDYQVTPDGQTIIFRTDVDGPGKYALFRTPLTGGITQRLSGANAPAHKVWGKPYPNLPGWGPFQPRENGFAVTNDSTRVVYLAETTTGVLQMFVTATAGSAPTQIAPYTGQGGIAPDGFRLTSDSQKVVFVSDHVTSGVFELYVSALSLPFLTKLNTTPLMDLRGGPRSRFGKYPLVEVSPNGQWVVFSACGTDPAQWQMFAVPTTGGMVRRLHGDLATTSAPLGRDIKFSADSRYVYFSAAMSFARTQYDLVVADLETGSWMIANPSGVWQGPTPQPWNVGVTDSPPRLVFSSWIQAQESQAYSAQPDGSGRKLLYDGYIDFAKVHRGGNSLIGLFRQTVQPFSRGIFTVPLAGGATQEYPLTNHLLYDFHAAPGRNALLCIGSSAGATRLYQFNLETGRFFRLSLSEQGPRGVADNEQQTYFSGDGERVFFIGEKDNIMELYSNALANGDAAADGIWLEVK